MTGAYDTTALQQTANEHLWMHNRDWVQMSEEGGPTIVVEGDGIRVVRHGREAAGSTSTAATPRLTSATAERRSPKP